MPSSNPRADRLAKSLQLCLSQSLGGMSRLRALGWFELLQDDWPVSESAPRVACEALFHLSVGTDGRWDGNPAVVVGIVSRQDRLRSFSASAVIGSALTTGRVAGNERRFQPR